MPFTVVPVKPIGTQKQGALVRRANGCGGPELVEMPVYPPSPEGARLRELRLELGLNQRQAAKSLGLSAVEWSGLESGSHTLGSREAWLRIRGELAAAARRAAAEKGGA